MNELEKRARKHRNKQKYPMSIFPDYKKGAEEFNKNSTPINQDALSSDCSTCNSVAEDVIKNSKKRIEEEMNYKNQEDFLNWEIAEPQCTGFDCDDSIEYVFGDHENRVWIEQDGRKYKVFTSQAQEKPEAVFTSLKKAKEFGEKYWHDNYYYEDDMNESLNERFTNGTLEDWEPAELMRKVQETGEALHTIRTYGDNTYIITIFYKRWYGPRGIDNPGELYWADVVKEYPDGSQERVFSSRDLIADDIIFDLMKWKRKELKGMNESLNESVDTSNIDYNELYKEYRKVYNVLYNNDDEIDYGASGKFTASELCNIFDNLFNTNSDFEKILKEFIEKAMHNYDAPTSDRECAAFVFALDNLYPDVMQELEDSNNSTNESLNEDNLNPEMRKDAKLQYKKWQNRRDRKKSEYDEMTDFVKDYIKSGKRAFEDSESTSDDIKAYKNLKDKYNKKMDMWDEEHPFHLNKYRGIEREDYPFYVTIYDKTATYEPAEGGYYVEERYAAQSAGYNTYEEAKGDMDTYMTESGEDWQQCGKDCYEWSTRYIGEGQVIRIETNKDYLKGESHYNGYESFNKNKYKSRKKPVKMNEADYKRFKRNNYNFMSVLMNKLGLYSFDSNKPSTEDGENFVITVKHPWRGEMEALYSKYLPKLKEIGAKRIKKEGGQRTPNGYIRFFIPKSTQETIISNLNAEEDERENAYKTSIESADISAYEPSEKIFNKIRDYRDRGSKINVNAIKDVNKALTYLYATVLLDWDSESGNLEWKAKELGADDSIINAIYERNNAQESDDRDDITKKTGLPKNDLIKFNKKRDKDTWIPKKLFMFFINNNIPVEIGDRKYGADYDRNGVQWSEREPITLFPGTNKEENINLVIHTNEGGGNNTYTLEARGYGNGSRVSINNVIGELSRKLNVRNESLKESINESDNGERLGRWLGARLLTGWTAMLNVDGAEESPYYDEYDQQFDGTFVQCLNKLKEYQDIIDKDGVPAYLALQSSHDEYFDGDYDTIIDKLYDSGYLYDDDFEDNDIDESLEESFNVSDETIEDAIEYYRENAFGFNGLKNYVETDFSHLPKEARDEIYKKMKKKLGESLNEDCNSYQYKGKTIINAGDYWFVKGYEEKFPTSDEAEEFIDDKKKDECVNINIRESLNKMDAESDNTYDLLNLYESKNLSKKQKKDIVRMIYENYGLEKIYNYLYEAVEEDEMSVEDRVNELTNNFKNTNGSYVFEEVQDANKAVSILKSKGYEASQKRTQDGKYRVNAEKKNK